VRGVSDDCGCRVLSQTGILAAALSVYGCGFSTGSGGIHGPPTQTRWPRPAWCKNRSRISGGGGCGNRVSSRRTPHT